MKTIESTAASFNNLPQGQYWEPIKQFQLPEIVESPLLIYKLKQYDKKREGQPTGEPGFKMYFFLFDLSSFDQNGIVKAIPGWAFAGGQKVITQLVTMVQNDLPIACQLGKVGEFQPKDKEVIVDGKIVLMKSEIVAIRALVDPDLIDQPGIEAFLEMYPSAKQLEALASMIVSSGHESQFVPTRVGV